MIEKKVESSGNVVGYKAIGTITASDYQQLGSEVKALVKKEGSIRLLIDLCEFKWEKMEAWLPDLKFGSEFHDEIQKNSHSRRFDLGEVDNTSVQTLLCS